MQLVQDFFFQQYVHCIDMILRLVGSLCVYILGCSPLQDGSHQQDYYIFEVHPYLSQKLSMTECLGIYDECKPSCRNPQGVIGRVYWDETSHYLATA